MRQLLSSKLARGMAVIALLGLLTGTAVVTRAWADGGGVYVARVEEDWVMVVGEPVADLSCPQVSTQMAADPTTTQFYQFHLNSQDVPSFVQGGLQLQAWDTDTVLQVKTSNNTNTMATSNEVVTWTQYLQRKEQALRFGISAASSTTWGDFSGANFDVQGAEGVLDNYDADYSMQNSGATFGVNHVVSLVLVHTRKIYSDDTASHPHREDDWTPRVVISPQE